MSDNFKDDLIKGKITEVIFEEMFSEVGKFLILHSGYEFKTPELAQELQSIERKDILDHLRNFPDYILLTKNSDKKGVYLVEVKYRSNIDPGEIRKIAEELTDKYVTVYLFIATQDNFYFDYCRNIINNNGSMVLLDDNWILKTVRDKYLELLDKYIPR
jgi:hypothetical protein